MTGVPELGGRTIRRWRRRNARPRRLRRLFDSVSARLLVIILCSVVPVAVLGALMAWHNYEATLDTSSNRAAATGEALKAHLDQQIIDTTRMLRALAAQPDLHDPERCGTVLRMVRALGVVPLADLFMIGNRNLRQCQQAGRGITEPPATGAPTPSRVVATPMLDGDADTRQPLLRLALGTIGPDGPAELVADMPLGWPRGDLVDPDLMGSRLGAGGGTEAWLVTGSGRLLPLCADCGWTDPATHGARPGSPAVGRFLSRNVVAGMDLLVTTLPNPAESRALAVFLWRVLAIALLLALCLAGVLIGASRLIVQPLRAVTRSVTQWRRAGAYAPRLTRSTPIELRQLSRAFSDATHALSAHEERLRVAESHQALLIKEIHHRVKNNLQIIASLLNLQANRIRQPEARAEFASARDRVRALATLHRHLYSDGELHTLNMRSFLIELCGQLFQAIGEKEGRRIRLEIEAPDIVMSTDQAVPLALVVTEAVSNAIKYAFPGGRSGVVSVRLTEEMEGIAKLVIQDNGIGIPAGRAETETGIRDGLGIQLIRGFARQLGATLEVLEGEADAEGRSEGTRYTLLVPLNPKVETYDEAQDADQEAPAHA